MTAATPPPIRAVIVDDHPVARYGIERIFEAHPRVCVVASVASIGELTAAGADPDIVMLDLYLGHGRTTAHTVAALAARWPVLVISQSARPADVLAAVRARAGGYLSKRATAEEYVTAIETVAAGGFYISSQLADVIQANDDPHARAGAQPVAQLTPREREVLHHIAQGLTQSQTAARLQISPGTVDTHLKRIRQKIGVGNKADLTRQAIQLAQIDCAGPEA